MSLLSRLGQLLIGWIFTHMSFIIPAKRLRETETLLAFHHPRPSHPFHVIILPKKDIRSFADLGAADPFIPDLVASVQDLVAEYHLPAYRLIVNGGDYQDFPYLHFHLISDVDRSNF
jgi:histidine triad (HIT) family protein